MSGKIKIPKGWHWLKNEAVIRRGDKFYDPYELCWRFSKTAIGFKSGLLETNLIYIRRNKKVKK